MKQNTWLVLLTLLSTILCDISFLDAMEDIATRYNLDEASVAILKGVAALELQSATILYADDRMVINDVYRGQLTYFEKHSIYYCILSLQRIQTRSSNHYMEDRSDLTMSISYNHEKIKLLEAKILKLTNAYAIGDMVMEKEGGRIRIKY